MATPPYARSLVCAAKRLRLQTSPPAPAVTTRQTRPLQQHTLPSDIHSELSHLRLPRAVQATYLAPLKRTPTHRIPTCDLQLRSYSLRNLEVFADFALRAAYYLHLPASGPVPLPRITERWTVPRSNFIFKKSQENFERITLRRLVQIQDGHPESVAIWLAFLRKYQYFGVGMKANVWEWSTVDGVAQELDHEAERIRQRLGEKADLFGTKEHGVNEEELKKMLLTEPFKASWGAHAPMSANSALPPANKRIEKERVGGDS